ncbi:ARM repeat-containing protein [Aaosphaeria arxii CBS 175.79]|uniref:ARM repeat-containing protein n=1 Tax=Aaosphaeria arxii CBS 175.79 TaxID=1450172 RepID=A0A6A5XTF0_9PLEO|nr:ARM repeat-containing protein [Aaosphaeria arxii CBS 175.79]KAF2016568.1 ARM repeat-containing protein [Aaosphaeria arxii CBS 175.79]
MPSALDELSNPTSPEAQVNALRNLRNEVVGHDQRKQLAIIHGIVKPLATVLRTEARKGGKKRRGNTLNGNSSNAPSLSTAHGGLSASGARNSSNNNQEWTTEDELRFQATQVVGSLVNGGPAFVAPLFAGRILHPLLASLSPSESPPKLVLATLRTLNQIADSILLEKPWQISTTEQLAGPSMSSAFCHELSTREVVDSLAEILVQPAKSYVTQQQISLVTKLIVKTCTAEAERKVLLDAGILDILAMKLAAMAEVDAQVLQTDTRPPSRDELPIVYLPDILEAISTIIKDSHYRTARLLYSQSIQQLFGTSKEKSVSEGGQASNHASTAWERLTPRLQTVQSNKSDAYTKSWPALGTAHFAAGSDSYPRLSSMDTLQPSGRTVIIDESENSFMIWLMFVARRGEERTRLSACWLLAWLKKFGEKWPLNDPSKTTRERHFSCLILPLVMKMIEESSPESEQSKALNNANPQAVEEHRFVLERAPLVLAEIVGGNKALQNVVTETKFLTLLVKILKRSFDPVTTSTKPLWSSDPGSIHTRDPSIDAPSSALGVSGFAPDVLHAFKYRESALLALAAITDTQDSLRKEIIQLGAVTHIIDSLVPYAEPVSDPSSSSSGNSGNISNTKCGNPPAVLIAACKLTRSLSRSIGVMRTSLIDHGIAQPSFELLRHPDVQVQIAATEVITNLVLEVSPMRNHILEAGAIKSLCEHCRSANFDLRYGSLWALKHLCLGLPYTEKLKCLDELGVGWLAQTLNGEPSRGSISTPLGMGTPNAAGEQVDILNAIDNSHMDVDDEAISDEDDGSSTTDSAPSVRQQHRRNLSYTSAANIRDRLQQIKTEELDPRLINERDEIRIQEQALDFIRNFISDEKDSGVTIDHCLKSFGHSRFFELLDAKIRAKGTPTSTTSHPMQSSTPSYWHNTSTTQQQQQQHRSGFTTSTTAPPQPQNWALFPPTELIIGTLYILVHLANGPPRHRSQLISQTALMQHVLPLFTHPSRDVRLPCAWFLNNLLWVENITDEAATRDRAQSLQALGFEEGARSLGRDTDLDVRERAKTAIEQMNKLLGISVSGGISERSTAVPGYHTTTGPGGGPFGGGSGSGGAGAGAGDSSSGLGRVGSGFGGLHSHQQQRWSRE